MIKTHKEFLLIEEKPESVQLFFNFLKKCGLEDKLIHAWNAEEVLNILLIEDISNLRLIVIGFNHSSSAQVDLINEIRNNDILKFIPIVALINSRAKDEVFKIKNVVIIELVSKPLDFLKFKIIIALAGYTFDDLLE